MRFLRLRYPALSLLLGVFAIAWIFTPTAGSDPARRPVTPRAVAPVSETALVFPASWRGDAAIDLAAGDLRKALSEVYGLPARVLFDDAPELPPYAIVALTPSAPFHERWVVNGALRPIESEGDGFRLQRIAFRGKPAITVQAAGIRGAAYGLFRLAEMTRLDPEMIRRPLDLRVEPKVALRLVSSPTGENYPTPEDALRWGYNAVTITQWPWLVTYDGFDPAIYGPVESDDRAWMQAHRARARAEIDRAKALHLQIVTIGDAIQLPGRVLDLYRDEVGLRADGPIFCLNRPKTRELYSYALRELLASFPEIDIVMVRTGENYPAGPITGNTPAKRECGADGANMPAMVRQVMDLSYEQIVLRAGKRYIQRAWDIGDTGFHANAAVANEILAGWEGRPGFTISFKHTQTDFWRYNPLNPNLGRTSLTRMVEYQAAREYEGKGAFPNYLGGLVAHGARETGNDGPIARIFGPNLSAVWVWARGGGWNGPNLKSDIWLDVNNYALSRLVWDPDLSARTLAQQWATLRFGPQAATHVVRVLDLSDEAVLRSIYVAPFARRQGAWAPNILWTRDDLVFGADRLGAIYQRSKEPGEFSEALAEKDLARRIVNDMAAEMRLAVQVASDPEIADQALTGVLYGESLVTILSHYFSGMFHYFAWNDGGRGDESLRRTAIEHLSAWLLAWRRYNDDVLPLPGAASGYLDNGMVSAVESALAELTAQR